MPTPLPSPSGCKSVVTQECHKVPKVVKKKVPHERCELVPFLDCNFVLKEVPVEDCQPKVKQDCNDEVKKRPYLEEEEECFEVVYDECYLVSKNHKSSSSKIVHFRLKSRCELLCVQGQGWMKQQYSCNEVLLKEGRERSVERKLEGRKQHKEASLLYHKEGPMIAI